MRKIIFTIAFLIMGFVNIFAQNPSKSPTHILIPAFPDVEVIKKFDEIQIGDSSLFKEIPNIGSSIDNPLENIPGANAINMIANSNDLNQPKDLSDSGHSLLNTHSLVVPEGWSGLSSYLTPDNTNIENLFLPYQNQLIILYNQQGVYYPAQQLNTLVNWDAQSGYIAKFNQETSIEFSGQPVQSKVLSLTTGWNLIPVLSECPADVATLFGNLDVVVVKEVAGWKLYWPEMGINTIDELLPGNAYYVLMNSPAEITFPNCGTPPWQCGDLLVDSRDGQTYTTVQIGDQCWMAENLNVGNKIDGINEQSNNGTIEKYCYDNLESNCDVYGGLYQWDEMMGYTTTPGEQGICPAGWHLPTDSEWCTITTYLNATVVCSTIGYSGTNAGGKMKETGTIHWSSPNNGAINSSGFTALPGGSRFSGGSFGSLGFFGNWWSSSPRDASIAWVRYLYYNIADVGRSSYEKSNSFSVRCLKDETTSTYIGVNPSNQNITALEGTTIFEVTSNTSWTVAENIAWFTVSPASGNNNGTITVTYEANTSPDPRSGQIIITAASGTPVVNVTVTQAAIAPFLTINPSNQNVTSDTGTTTFEVTSNSSWTVTESVSWISVSPAGGSNNGAITVTYEANTTSSRVGQITFTAAGVADVANVTITQAGVSWACGSTISVNHIVGVVAPVTKTVTYGTVTNIPGATSKCWITSNLGADHQATAVNDATEASAGWYWQFNRKQGYKHEGTNRTPNTTWITSINEDSDWTTTNDPCALELGSGWRIPTKTEWANVDASGNWGNWNGPWNSGLKVHAAGYLFSSSGSLNYRGSDGYYWSSKQDGATNSGILYFESGGSGTYNYNKAFGYSLRCIKD